MKKVLWLGLLVAAVMVLGATFVLAQEQPRATDNPVEAAPAVQLPAPDVRPGFVDADGDGVCDNCGQGPRNPNAPRPNFVDEDGDGVCDNCGTGMGNGGSANFVDADGDGVCDNMGQNMGQANGKGRGQGQAPGQGTGLGGGFRGGRGG